MIGIYKITSPSKKIYIGQSIDIQKRWQRYKSVKYKRTFKLYCSFQKYGIDNHLFEIIEECAVELLNEREIYYIKYFDTFNTSHGLNLKEGGAKGRISEETRERYRKASIGRVVSEKTKQKLRDRVMTDEWRLAISKSKKGIARSIESRNKTSIALRGRKQSDEQIKKRVNKLIGQKRTLETREKMGAYKGEKSHMYGMVGSLCVNSKKVVQIDKKTNANIKIYDSQATAQRETGIKQGDISRVCRGIRLSAGNFLWKFI